MDAIVTKGHYFEELEVGQEASYRRTVTEADIQGFAEVSGDTNPVHLDETYAAGTPFKGRIAHGMLTASVISAAIAGRLPGPGAVYLAQNLRFKAPARPGDTVHATVTVTALDEVKRRASLSTICTVNGKTVIDGDAVVMPTSRAKG